MDFWDVAGAGGAAVDPALSWFEALYRIQKDRKAAQAGQDRDTLSALLDTRGARHATALDRMQKGAEIDKSPYQAKSDWFREQEKSKAFQQGVLGAEGAATRAYTDTMLGGPQLKRPGMLAEPSPTGGPLQRLPGDEEARRAAFRKYPSLETGAIQSMPPGSSAAMEFRAPEISQEDVRGTLAANMRATEQRSAPLRRGMDVPVIPEEERLLRAKLAAVDGLVNVSPGMKNYAKAKIMAEYAAERERRQELAMAAAGTEIYRQERPETTVPALAEKAIVDRKERERLARENVIKTAGIHAWPSLKRAQDEEKARAESQRIWNEQRQAVAEKYADLEELEAQILAGPEGPLRTQGLEEIARAKVELKNQNLAFMAPGLPVKPGEALSAATRGIVEGHKKPGAGRAAEKKPDLNKPIANAQKRLETARDAAIMAPNDPEKRKAAAQAEADLNALLKKQNAELGLDVEDVEIPPEPPKPPSQPGIIDRVKGIFTSGGEPPKVSQVAPVTPQELAEYQNAARAAGYADWAKLTAADVAREKARVGR